MTDSGERGVQRLNENLAELWANVTAPVELGEPSGDWISAREARAIVEKLTDGDQGQAIAAICRRAVTAVPVRASTYSRAEDPHDYIDRLDFADREGDLSHFKRTLTQRSFEEICGFFEVIGDTSWDANNGLRAGVEYAVWDTGDFKAKVPMDFSDVTLTVVGLQFDRKALRSSFGEEPQPHVTPAFAIRSNGGGRPPKYDWEGALIHIAALANLPDGLPTGPGAQAEIARRIADWFASAAGECPADSEIRRRASRIMQALLGK